MKYSAVLLWTLFLSLAQTLQSQNIANPAKWHQEVKQKIERGDDINFRDSVGQTFIIKAIKYQDLKMVEYLIKKGADINRTDTNGTTPLMHAVATGNLEIAQTLIKNQADYMICDKQGQSALSYAEKSKNEKVIKLIQKYIIPIKWISITEAEALCKKEPRKIIIDVYTDWCGWCKVMDQKTFSNPYISNYIATHFYAVKFNAETKDSLIFNGTKYKSTNPALKKSAHQLAAFFLKGKLGYPSLVFLDEKLNEIQYIQGYQKINEMEIILNYFNTNQYKDKDFQIFKKEFKSNIKGFVAN